MDRGIDELGRVKIHCIVEMIKQYDFCFEAQEVIDDPYGVLDHFGVFEHLSFEEEGVLVSELLKLAENFEVREAERWAACNRLCSI